MLATPDPRVRFARRLTLYVLVAAFTLLVLSYRGDRLRRAMAPVLRSVNRTQTSVLPVRSAGDPAVSFQPSTTGSGTPDSSVDATLTGATPDSPLHMAAPTFTVPPAGAIPAASAVAAAPVIPATATPPLPTDRVGILAGHWGYDTGAVCADGLREVDVTTDVAARIKAILNTRGLTVDILREHDPDVPAPPLQGYRAAALVSVHVDSCSIPGLSGYKVARWRYSLMPETDDRLVACLNRRYGAATGLGRHDNSININMWNYYAFREIGADTPGAIIELGFLLGDRQAIDGKRFEMALGVADGITCFLRGETP